LWVEQEVEEELPALWKKLHQQKEEGFLFVFKRKWWCFHSPQFVIFCCGSVVGARNKTATKP